MHRFIVTYDLDSDDPRNDIMNDAVKEVLLSPAKVTESAWIGRFCGSSDDIIRALVDEMQRRETSILDYVGPDDGPSQHDGDQIFVARVKVHNAAWSRLDVEDDKIARRLLINLFELD